MNHFQLTLHPDESRCDAPASSSLLEAALASELPLPSSCRIGTCRTCLCKLVTGRIRYRINWPGISAEEKAAGFILPCVALPESDVTLEIPHPSDIA